VSKTENLKICLAASSGGHLTQLLKLSESWRGYDIFFMTTTTVVREKLSRFGKVYIVGECNRRHPIRVLLVLSRCIKIVFRERPGVVISTGAAVGCLVSFLAKILGAKIIWIDSITNVEKMSLSGRMVKHIADLVLVQWIELVDKYSNVEYVGKVI